MTRELHLKGVSLKVFLGVLPEEERFSRAVQCDLTHTGPRGTLVDYTEVCACLETLNRQRFDYIEELAERVLSLLSSRWPGLWRVTVRKSFPPVHPGMESAEVTVEG